MKQKKKKKRKKKKKTKKDTRKRRKMKNVGKGKVFIGQRRGGFMRQPIVTTSIIISK